MSIQSCIGAESAGYDIIDMINKRIEIYKKRDVSNPQLFEEFRRLKQKIQEEIIDPASDGWY